MIKALRRHPHSSTGLLMAGIAAVFLTAAAPAQAPAAKKAPAAPPPAGPVTASAAPTAPAVVVPATPVVPAAQTPVPAKPPMPKQVSVTIDQTKMLELDGPVSTVSVGNPSIADVNIQNGRLFLVGKSFGRTNILALGPTGESVLDMMVFVTSTGGGSVTVYKGNKQLTYNCTPTCDRTLMPGDSGTDFDMISGQMNTKMDSGASKHSE